MKKNNIDIRHLIRLFFFIFLIFALCSNFKDLIIFFNKIQKLKIFHFFVLAFIGGIVIYPLFLNNIPNEVSTFNTGKVVLDKILDILTYYTISVSNFSLLNKFIEQFFLDGENYFIFDNLFEPISFITAIILPLIYVFSKLIPLLLLIVTKEEPVSFA